ncbi:MAG: hypothetical protein WC238_06185 [Parcubacteria group bacterium]|jgi:hypothetical protein
MKISIMVKGVANLGDHGMEQHIAHECDPQETVGELVDRLLVEKSQGFMSSETISRPNYYDVIEIRLEKPKEV